MTRWLWLGGWGADLDWQLEAANQRWPQITHEFVLPTSNCIHTLIQKLQTQKIERILGYSLGTLLLLRNRHLLPDLPLTLIAPILDFKSEADQGGRVETRRLKILLRWLKRDPIAALRDFSSTADMPETEQITTLPYDLDQLIWGIEYLRDYSAEVPTGGQIKAVLGDRDSLLDAARMSAIWPELKVVPHAGHDLTGLLPEVTP